MKEAINLDKVITDVKSVGSKKLDATKAKKESDDKDREA